MCKQTTLLLNLFVKDFLNTSYSIYVSNDNIFKYIFISPVRNQFIFTNYYIRMYIICSFFDVIANTIKSSCILTPIQISLFNLSIQERYFYVENFNIVNTIYVVKNVKTSKNCVNTVYLLFFCLYTVVIYNFNYKSLLLIHPM